MMTIAIDKVEDLTEVDAVSLSVEGNQARVQRQVEETPINMIQLGNNALWMGFKTASGRFLETIMTEFFRRRSVCYVILH